MTSKPDIELKRITHNARLSEETMAYAADLYVDGILIAHVSNDGHGGCDRQHPAQGKTYADIEKLEALIKASYPAIPRPDFPKIDGKVFEFQPTLESVCSDLVADHLMAKDLQRLLKRTVAFIPGGTTEVRTYKGKNEGEQRAHLITETLRRDPGAKILNNLPFAEALAAYKATAS